MWMFGKKSQKCQESLPESLPCLDERRPYLEQMIDTYPSLAGKVLMQIFDRFPQSRHLNLAISVVSAEMGVRFNKESLERFVMEKPSLAQDAAKRLIRFRRSDIEPIIVSYVVPYGGAIALNEHVN